MRLQLTRWPAPTVCPWAASRTDFRIRHPLGGVGLACARGAVVEKQLRLPTGTSVVEMTPGVSRQGPSGYIHAVAHLEGAPAVTIHAYSPPLTRVGQYRVDGEGVLRRTIEHGRQELLDYSIAELDADLV